MRQIPDRSTRLHLYTALAAGAVTPQMTADIRVYSGPPIAVDGITTLSLQNLQFDICLLYTSPSPRDQRGSRMPSSA